MKNIIQGLKVVALAVLLTLGLSYVYAWTAPLLSPPTGNVTAPLNTSGTDQTKAGSLSVASLLDSNNPLFFLNPNGDSVLKNILVTSGDVCTGWDPVAHTWTASKICLSTLASGSGSGTNGVVFSNGSDGDVELSSNTTQSRDYHYNNLTIDSDVTLNTNGYRLLVANTLINNGTITTSPGSTGTLSGGGAGGSGAQAGYRATCNLSQKTPCTNGANVVALGGHGGGVAEGCAAGNTSSENIQIIKQIIPSLQNLSSSGETGVSSVSDQYYLVGSGSTSGINLSGGGGGGAGNSAGCDDHGSHGGGGGNGGGVILVAAKTLTNNGTITAPGGGGGSSGGYYMYDPSGTGGGGGGGGAVVLIYKTLTGSGTVTAPGGPGGWSCGGYYGRTTPCGRDGYPGSDGNIYKAKIL